MEAPIRDLDIEQGTDWEEIVDFLDEDDVPFVLTGWQFDFVAKRVGATDGEIAFRWGVTIVSTEDPDTTDRAVSVRLTPESTNNLILAECDQEQQLVYEWDAIDESGFRQRWAKGSVRLHRRVHAVGGGE